MAKRAAASKAAAVTTGEVVQSTMLPGVSEDEQLAGSLGASIVEFIRGLAGFFTTAKAMETAAVARLEQARALIVPTNEQEDAKIQAFCRSTTIDRKLAEDHWSITSKVHGLHKRLVAARSRATEPLEKASTIANKLHFDYVEAERRRVAAEQERLRLEAERKAREERQRELDALEAEAIKREEASADLSEREQFFVDNVARLGMDAQRGAQQAGYKDPIVQAARLMSKRKIQDAIKAKREALAIRTQAAARKEEVLEYDVETVEARVLKPSGGFDRTTHSADVVDAQALIAAVIAGGHGIPTDVLMVNPAKINEYARSLHERINLWPGVKYRKNGRVV